MSSGVLFSTLFQFLILFGGWEVSVWLGKRLYINAYFSFGLGVSTVLGSLVLLAGWITTFGISLSPFVSWTLCSSIFAFFTYKKLRRKTLDTSRLTKYEYIQISFLIIVAQAVSVLNSRFGDLGWDSNAYHLPLAYELQINSALNWDESMGQGYYTFFAPYGVHSLFALGMALSGTNYAVTAINALFAVSISLLAGGISASLGVRQVTVILSTIGTLFIPSVIGQIGHNYIDLATGTFWLASASTIFILYLNRSFYSRNDNFFKCIIATFVVLIGSSLSAKTHQIAQILPLLISFFLLIFKLNEKRNILRSISVIGVAVVAGSFPYFRNWLEYGNPIFPIKNSIFQNGNIALSEFSPMFDGFRPKIWASGFVPLDSLIITPLVSMTKVLMVNLGILYDKDRPDLALFTYDSTISGAGGLFTISNSLGLIVVCFFIIKNYQSLYKLVKTKRANVTVVFLCISIVSIVVTPGSYWPRYILGPAILFSILMLCMLQKYLVNKAVEALLFFLIPLVIFGNIQSYKYETERFRNSDSKIYGLNGSLPIDFLNNCQKVVVLEPRPVFTSLISYANCKNISHKSVEDIAVWINSGNEYWLVASKEVLGCSSMSTCRQIPIFEESPKIELRMFSSQRAWFDERGLYETLLIKIERSSND